MNANAEQVIELLAGKIAELSKDLAIAQAVVIQLQSQAEAAEAQVNEETTV